LAVAAAGLLSGTVPPVALDVELPGSAEPVPAARGSAEVVDGDELESFAAPVEPLTGAEAGSELESAGGVATGAGDAGADDVDGFVGSDAGAVVVPPAGLAGLVVGGVEPAAVGPAPAGADGAPSSSLGPDSATGAEPPVAPEPEPADVDVEVAPFDVVAVVEDADGGVPTEVEVTSPGAVSGAPNGPASELPARCDGRAAIEASSLSRVVGGAVAR
jgi:hypothetical protein